MAYDEPSQGIDSPCKSRGAIFAVISGMKRAHGYTLIELAIVLMVLALLMGGLLKWQASEEALSPAPASVPK